MNEVGFTNEKQMQKFVEGNIETLFSGMTFLKTEFRDMMEGERRLDTIAFDTSENTFVVIEYKNRQDGRAVPQAKAYLKDMRDNKGDLMVEYSKKMNCMVPDKKSFCWDAMYAIIMAPEFERLQIPAAADDRNLELYEIRRYDDHAVMVDRVGGAHVHKYPQESPGERKPETGNLPISELYETIRKRLLEEFPGMELHEKKSYDAFKLPGSKRPNFCETVRKRDKIWLFLARHVKLEQNAPGFVTSINGLDILDEADFDKALVLLKRQHMDWPRYKRGESITYNPAV